ncbi:MAG: hypothetical protein H0V29_09275 [Thermoleophilaceae bacterium]|nr:hypothetical protein [Thermoleophilaceae bacterium]
MLARLTAKVNAHLRAEARRRHPRVPGRFVDLRAPQVSALTVGLVTAGVLALPVAVVLLLVS